MGNKDMFKLILNLKSNSVVLLENSLIKIDGFTTFFKNKEELKEKLFENNEELRNAKITIEQNGNAVSFIGSDFRNVSKTYSDSTKSMEYANSLSEVDLQVLTNYFTNVQDSELLRGEEVNLVKNIVSTINIIKSKGKVKGFDSDISNLKYFIRTYCNSYRRFRDIYCYMEAMSILPRLDNSYTEEEKQEFNKIFEYIKNNLNGFGKDNLTISSNKEKLKKEAYDLGKGIQKEEFKNFLLQEATEIGKNIVKTEKDDSFVLEYKKNRNSDSFSNDNSFKDYLKEYYKTENVKGFKHE